MKNDARCRDDWKAQQKASQKAVRLFDSQPGFCKRSRCGYETEWRKCSTRQPSASKDVGSIASAELAMKYFNLRAELFSRLTWKR